MQEKVEIITNDFEHYWTKIPKNGYCDKAGLPLELHTNLLEVKMNCNRNNNPDLFY